MQLSTTATGAVSEQRLWQRHAEMAQIGATARGGVNRQALTPEEAEARALLVAWAETLGFEVYVDGIANLFIRRAGADPEALPVMTGSHIDTQPTGGRFDGIYGILAGLEALQVMEMSGECTRRPIEVVVWTNEEGCRFAPGMMGSEAFVGVRSLESILAVVDEDGVSVREALSVVLNATPQARRRPLGIPVSAFVEAHIEQGPELEVRGVPVGVVTGIQGVRRFRVSVTGEEAHAGTTSRRQRKDALAAAVRMVGALEESVRDYEDEVRFTVGMFKPTPNAPSVVAGHVLFSIDLRHPRSAVLQALGDRFGEVCRREAGGCEVVLREIARAEPLMFPSDMLQTIQAAAARLDVPYIDIYSGAGHDARQLHRVCPTGMIFVPCERGISHNEAENAKPGDLAAGARVLTEVLLDLARR